jgi:hypothetical protein
MMLVPNSRKIAGIFIDGTNLYFVQKQFLDFKVDILKLVRYFANYFVIYNTFFIWLIKKKRKSKISFTECLPLAVLLSSKKL